MTETNAEKPAVTGTSPLPTIMLVVALIGPDVTKIGWGRFKPRLKPEIEALNK
jgi:hypothetical protein